MSRAAVQSRELVKISTLAERSGVPLPTIKHYLRMGLLPPPVKRTGRNMAYYDPEAVERIRTIKQLQRDHFLPLEVIREVLEAKEPVSEPEAAAAVIASVLESSAPAEVRTRADLVASGVPAADLERFEALGLLTPEGAGAEARYRGDDLTLLRTLGAARKAGLSDQMLPPEILAAYVASIQQLVQVELRLFAEGVFPRAEGRLAALTEAATHLSEKLVVLIRRKLLVPTLKNMVREAAEAPARRPAPRKKRASKRRSP